MENTFSFLNIHETFIYKQLYIRSQGKLQEDLKTSNFTGHIL